MKKLISERLILLAKAKESMMNTADVMERWEEVQLLAEENVFETIITSDKILNMLDKCNQLDGELQEYCQKVSQDMNFEKDCKVIEVMEEIRNLFHSIYKETVIASEISHKIEEVVAYQKEIEEEVKESLMDAGENLDAAEAGVELIMAEL